MRWIDGYHTHIRIYALKLADLICKLDEVHTWQTGKPRELIKIDKIWTQKHRVDQLTVREKPNFANATNANIPDLIQIMVFTYA